MKNWIISNLLVYMIGLVIIITEEINFAVWVEENPFKCVFVVIIQAFALTVCKFLLDFSDNLIKKEEK